MSTEEKLILILILSIVAVSLVYGYLWTFAVDVVGQALARPNSSVDRLSELPVGFHTFDRVICCSSVLILKGD